MSVRLLCGFLLFTGLQAASLHVVPAWKTGQTYNLLIEKSFAGTQPQASLTASTSVQMIVKEAGPQGAKVEWIYGDTKMSGAAQMQSSIMQLAAGSLRNTHLELSITPEGKLKQLTNSDQVQAALGQTVTKVTDALAAKVQDPKQQQQLRLTLARVLNPSTLLASAIRDVQLLLSLSGASLDSAKPTVMNLQGPQPLGTPGTIHSKLEYVLEKVEGKQAKVRLTQTFDPVQLGPLVQKMAPNANLPSGAGDQTVNITDVATFGVNTTLGLPTEVQYERLVKIGTVTRSEITKMHLSPA